jgi:hypothetical protein
MEISDFTLRCKGFAAPYRNFQREAPNVTGALTREAARDVATGVSVAP